MIDSGDEPRLFRLPLELGAGAGTRGRPVDAGVIHAAINHDFAQFAENCAEDEKELTMRKSGRSRKVPAACSYNFPS